MCICSTSKLNSLAAKLLGKQLLNLFGFLVILGNSNGQSHILCKTVTFAYTRHYKCSKNIEKTRKIKNKPKTILGIYIYLQYVRTGFPRAKITLSIAALYFLIFAIFQSILLNSTEYHSPEQFLTRNRGFYLLIFATFQDFRFFANFKTL